MFIKARSALFVNVGRWYDNHMERKIILWKEEGETPLECILRAKEEGKIQENDKATYAGRLDPMAEGVLLVLVGNAVHEKDAIEEWLKFFLEGVTTTDASSAPLFTLKKGSIFSFYETIVSFIFSVGNLCCK